MDYTQIGVSAAVVIVVIAFLAEMRMSRREFLKTIENHLAHSTKAIDQLCSWLKGKMGD